MKNFTFLQAFAMSMFLVCNFTVSAQLVITEYNKTMPDTHLKHWYNTNIDEYDTVLDDSGQKLYTLKNSSSKNVLLSERNAITDVTFNVNLEFDSEQFNPNLIIVYNENGFVGYLNWFGTNPISVDLPPGTYDFAVDFTDGFPWEQDIKHYFVINELVDVQESGETTLDVSEANNHVTALVYNEMGENLEPGILDIESGTTTGGNSTLMFQNILIFEPSDLSVFSSAFTWGWKYSADEEPIWNYYINDLSQRYNIIQNVIVAGYNGKHYFSKFETLTGISESLNREIDSESWLLHQNQFQSSILGESSEISYQSYTAAYLWEGYSLGGVNLIYDENMPEEGISLYLNNPIIEGDSANLLVFPAITDYVAEIIPGFGEEGFFIGGNAVIKGDNEEVFYGSGFTGTNFSILSDDFYRTDERGWKLFPFNPKFSYTDSENTGTVQGNNTPISVIGTVTNPTILFKGRFGEKREGDLFSTNVEVKQNEEVVFSGSFIEYRNWAFPETGDIEVSFSNSNVMVDGLAGTNTTTVNYNATDGDNPPTLQMLQLRDTSGKVTDRFDFANEGTVRIAAGDFQYNWDTAVYDYEEGNIVELYYSLYNQNNWVTLELTEYPEHFFLPAFGNYYEASLEGIELPAENSWFDLKIVCTDSAGNQQEQIVSPAFKVNSTLSVNDHTFNGLIVYPNPFSEELQAQLPASMNGNYTFEIFDLTGKILHSEERNTESSQLLSWNGSTLAAGVYVLNITHGKQSLSKLIVKK